MGKLKEKLVESSSALEAKKLEIRNLRARVIANDKGIKRLENIISSQQKQYHELESRFKTPSKTVAIDGFFDKDVIKTSNFNSQFSPILTEVKEEFKKVPLDTTPDKLQVHDRTGGDDRGITYVAPNDKPQTLKPQLASLKSCTPKTCATESKMYIERPGSNETYPCLLCNITFSNFKSLISHILKYLETHPNGELIYTCNICMINMQECSLKEHVGGRKHKTKKALLSNN